MRTGQGGGVCAFEVYMGLIVDDYLLQLNPLFARR